MTRAPWRPLALIWAGPCSVLGLVLALAALACGGRAGRAAGTLEVVFRRGPVPRNALTRRLPCAFTLGHVVLATGSRELEFWRAHERVHVAQYERWGAAFLVAYAAAGLWLWLRGRRAYWDNPFEIAARRQSAEAANTGGSSS